MDNFMRRLVSQPKKISRFIRTGSGGEEFTLVVPFSVA
jgi:hypothetical protein